MNLINVPVCSTLTTHYYHLLVNMAVEFYRFNGQKSENTRLITFKIASYKLCIQINVSIPA